MFFTLKKVNESKIYNFSAKNGLINETIDDISKGFYYLKSKNKKTLIYLNKGANINFYIDSIFNFTDKTNLFLSKWIYKANNIKKIIQDSSLKTSDKINLFNKFISKSKFESKNINNKDFTKLFHFYLNYFKSFNLLELYNNSNNDKELKKIINSIKIDNPLFIGLPESIDWLDKYFDLKETILSKKIDFKQRINFIGTNLVKEIYTFKTIKKITIDENLYKDIELALKFTKNSFRIKQLKKLKKRAKKCSKGTMGYNFRYPTNKNKLLSFTDLIGKPFYLLLWETKNKKTPIELTKYYQLEKINKNYNFNSVCLNYDAYTWREYFKKNKIKGISFITKNGKFLKEYYSIKKLPIIVKFDKNGKIEKMNVNILDL